ncbi:MAG: type II secretion system protein [Candidatus Paceibacterota bacterium]|jgi:prepilin-type N-terminal cleavage/methylation domain-containing protein
MRRGFTLIEILITTALFLVTMVAMTQLYIAYGRVIELQKSSISVALDGSSIVEAVRTAGLQADHVVAAHTFSGEDYTTGTTTALFELPAVDASGAIIENAYDYIGIYASSTSVYRTIDAAPGSARVSGSKRLTQALDALRFTYDNASIPLVGSVTVDATTSAMLRGETTQVHLHQHIQLRNL